MVGSADSQRTPACNADVCFFALENRRYDDVYSSIIRIVNFEAIMDEMRLKIGAEWIDRVVWWIVCD